MNTKDIKLAALERDEKAYKLSIALSDALNRLYSNKDFNKVILTGFMKDEAVRLVHAKAEPSLQSAENQALLDKEINAIGCLVSFFNTVEQQANMAKRALDTIDQQREVIIDEDEDQ